jgi:hypothetical protein
MRNKALYAAAGLAVIATPFILAARANGSDHADTREVVSQPGSDISDVYMFPAPGNPKHIVLVMNVNPLIPRGGGGAASFDPNVLYQFKIDRTGDSVEDLVIQAKFSGTGAGQTVQIAGPIKPSTTGNMNRFETPHGTTGTINATFSPAANLKVFAGAREDSFFFDLEQFFTILPDRGVPPGLTTPPANPNQPMAGTWRAPGTAVDFLSNGGFNVLSIVVELPKSMLQ